MKKQHIISSLRAVGILATCASLLVLLGSAAPAPTTSLKVGVVNFKSCFEGSKLGKQEQGRFEQIKKNLENKIESLEKEINEMAPKFSDEYLDTLSPEAEAELKNKYEKIAHELSSHQNQYYSMLQQANYQIVQQVNASVELAATKVAEAKGLDFAINKDMCFYNAPGFDISKDVIAEMDAQFDSKPVDTKPAEKK